MWFLWTFLKHIKNLCIQCIKCSCASKETFVLPENVLGHRYVIYMYHHWRTLCTKQDLMAIFVKNPPLGVLTEVSPPPPIRRIAKTWGIFHSENSTCDVHSQFCIGNFKHKNEMPFHQFYRRQNLVKFWFF